MGKRYDAIVTDASQRVALEITRALGISGLKVLAVEKISSNCKTMSGVSRFCTSTAFVQDYTGGDFLDLCNDAATVFPVSTNTIMSVYENAFVKFPDRFLLPPPDLFRRSNGKMSIIEEAEKCGIPCPKTIKLSRSSANPPDISSAGFTFPVVLKLLDDEGLFLEPKQRYHIARSQSDIEIGWKNLLSHGKDIIMQEYIGGRGYGWSAVYGRDHKCLADFAHLRLREYPATGGPSSFCISTKDEDLRASGRKLLDLLGWTGPAMVEFKKDEKDGRFKLLEINPRYWGSLPLARHSGINLPSIQHDYMRDIPSKSNGYEENVKLKFKAMDLLAAIQEFKTSGKRMHYILNYIGECLNPSIADGIWMWTDPLPMLIYIFHRIK